MWLFASCSTGGTKLTPSFFRVTKVLEDKDHTVEVCWKACWAVKYCSDEIVFMISIVARNIMMNVEVFERSWPLLWGFSNALFVILRAITPALGAIVGSQKRSRICRCFTGAGLIDKNQQSDEQRWNKNNHRDSKMSVRTRAVNHHEQKTWIGGNERNLLIEYAVLCATNI
jgi:hypothetical protein